MLESSDAVYAVNQRRFLVRTQNIDRLRATGQATEVTRTFTRDEIFAIAIAAAERNLKVPLSNPQLIEFTPRFLLRFRTTQHTSLEYIVQGLAKAGVPVEQNLESFRHALQVSPQTLHQIACGCHKPFGTGGVIANKLREAQAQDPWR
jgi:hypothetical protein